MFKNREKKKAARNVVENYSTCFTNERGKKGGEVWGLGERYVSNFQLQMKEVKFDVFITLLAFNLPCLLSSCVACACC